MTYLAVLLFGTLWIASVWAATRVAWYRGRSSLLGAALAVVLPFLGLWLVTRLPRNRDLSVLRRAAVHQRERVEEEAALEARDQAALAHEAEAPSEHGRAHRAA